MEQSQPHDTIARAFEFNFWVGVLVSAIVVLGGVVAILYRDAKTSAKDHADRVRAREKEFSDSEKANIQILTELKNVLVNFRLENTGMHANTLKSVEQSEQRITERLRIIRDHRDRETKKTHDDDL